MSSVPASRLVFDVAAMTTRLVFGPGSRARVPELLDAQGYQDVVVLCTQRGRAVAEELAGGLGARVVAVFDGAREHVPRPLVDEAVEVVRRSAPDAAVAVGGGSTIGLAKALALESGLPYLAVPTTYAGSEMTPIWGVTTDGVKTTGTDESVRPVVAVYDAELTTSLPVDTSTTSGLNAIAHAAEALYAANGSPLVDLLAQESVQALGAALEALPQDPTDLAARAQALYGAALAGLCLGASATSLHHKLCHVLGGTLDLPHAATHAAVLPYVLAFNLPAAPRADAVLREALGGADPVTRLWRLGRPADRPRTLAGLGMVEADLDRVVQRVLAALGTPQANPRPVLGADVERILGAALVGSPPERRLAHA